MPARKPEECDLLLIEALHAGNLDAAVALYEPDASFVLQSGEVITGRQAIREVMKEFLALKPRFSMDVQAVQNGDLA
ncbi:MAG: nuclear transport factor 2 family protein, partial [Thermodesulfobacteriota bacterium]